MSQMNSPIKKSYFLFILFIVLVGVVSYFLLFKKSDKTGYVNTSILLEKYQGMVDAREQFKTKAKAWQENTDTLTSDLQQSIKDYEKNLSSMSAREKKLNEEVLKNKQKQLAQYQQATQKMAQDEEQRLTVGPLGQINEYINMYGKDKGYKFIFGTSSSNILYADSVYDLTNDILKGLNDRYTNGK